MFLCKRRAETIRSAAVVWEQSLTYWKHGTLSAACISFDGHVRPEWAKKASSMATHSDPPPPPTVLVADDSETTRRYVKSILEGEGMNVVLCEDGKVAFDRICKGGIDLALLDGEMPQMTGLECCRLVKAQNPEPFLPVILFAAQGDPTSRVQGLKNGADDFVPKPFEDDELIVRIRNMLKIRQMHKTVQAAKSRLEELAGREENSNLFTDKYLRSRLHQEFRRAERYQEPLALMLLSAANLADASFEHGRSAVDAWIAEVSKQVAQELRETDVLARYEKNFIAAILPNTHFQGAMIASERVLRRIDSGAFSLAGAPFAAHFNIGVSLFPSESINSSTAMLSAAAEAFDEAAKTPDDNICVSQHNGYFFR